VGTFYFIAFNLLIGILNLQDLGFEKFNTFFEIFPGAGKLKHHQPFLAGKNRRIQDIENQIILTGERAYNGVLYDGLGKS